MRLSDLRSSLTVLRDGEFSDLGLLGTTGLGYLVDKKYADKVNGPVIATREAGAYVDERHGLAVADDPETAFWGIHGILLNGTFYSNRSRVEKGFGCRIHQTAAIGQDGFEVHKNSRITHGGWVKIGNNVSIGAHCTVDKSVWNVPTEIGDDTNIDNLVHIAHNCRIGQRCFIAAGAIFGGSVTLGNDVFVGLGSVFRPGVTVGDGAFIGMGIRVIRDVAAGERVTQ